MYHIFSRLLWFQTFWYDLGKNWPLTLVVNWLVSWGRAWFCKARCNNSRGRGRSQDRCAGEDVPRAPKCNDFNCIRFFLQFVWHGWRILLLRFGHHVFIPSQRKVHGETKKCLRGCTSCKQGCDGTSKTRYFKDILTFLYVSCLWSHAQL